MPPTSHYKNKHSYRWIILASFSLGLVVNVLAASDSPSSRRIKIRVAATEIAGGHHTLWLRTGPGRDPIKIELNTSSFSKPIEAVIPTVCAFHSSATNAAAEKEPEPIASAVLKSKSVLLLFAPAKKRGEYEVTVIQEGEFPFGSFLIANFSGTPVRAEIGRKAVTLKHGAKQSFAYRKPQRELPVRLLVVRKGGKPRIVRQSSWSITPDRRELVILFKRPSNGLVRFLHFVDLQEPVAATE